MIHRVMEVLPETHMLIVEDSSLMELLTSSRN